MKTVAFSFLGTQLDFGKGADRWRRWRPTVGLCQQEDLLIDRLELLYPQRHHATADLVCQDIQRVSPETTVRRHLIDFTNPWDFEEVYGRMLDFMRGYEFNVDAERYLANLTTGTHVAQICWFLLTEARYLPGQLIQLSPPPKRSADMAGSYQIIDLDLSRYDAIASRFAQEQAEGTSFLKSGIETRNTSFNALIDEIEKVVIRSTAPVLLTGPTGSGKTQLARRIYDLKRLRHRIEGQFVEVNCATLRGDNALSALFGHRRGSFTGAVTDRDGLLKAADQGLLFLDEIGELGLDEQAMMLRAIEEKRFSPLGSDGEVTSSFQLIAGTNRDLRADVRSGRFRADLLARIDLWTYRLPGLHERVEDLPGNIAYELQRQASESGVNTSFNKEAEHLYAAFATSPRATWSGNFRDLGASITRLATLADGGRITVPIVHTEIDRLTRSWQSCDEPQTADVLSPLVGEEGAAQIDAFDRVQLIEVIRVCRAANSLSAAGRELFDYSRTRKKSHNDADRLKKYLARFGLDWASVTQQKPA